MIAYKATDKNMCGILNTQYKFDKEFIMDGSNIKAGSNGFHYCTEIYLTGIHYNFQVKGHRYFQVEISDNAVLSFNKLNNYYASNKIY
jgi:hypothetical protein